MQRGFSKIVRRILVGLAFGAVVLVSFSLYANLSDLKASIAKFNYMLLPVLFALTLGNYFFRFTKWHYYLRVIGVKLSIPDSMAVFFSGLVMVITPAKMGELLKAYLVKRIDGSQISKTAPVVVAERLTDFWALVILSLAGIFQYAVKKAWAVIIVVVVLLVLFWILVSWRGLMFWFVGKFERSKFELLRKVGTKLKVAYDSAYQLVRFGPTLWATILSLFAWLFECIGLYLVIRALGLNVPVSGAIFIYAFSTITGAISMLPGGLGMTEVSMSALLKNLTNLAKADSVAATLIIRAVTLWFAVLLGAAVLVLNSKRFAPAVAELEAETS